MPHRPTPFTRWLALIALVTLVHGALLQNASIHLGFGAPEEAPVRLAMRAVGPEPTPPAQTTPVVVQKPKPKPKPRPVVPPVPAPPPEPIEPLAPAPTSPPVTEADTPPELAVPDSVAQAPESAVSQPVTSEAEPLEPVAQAMALAASAPAAPPKESDTPRFQRAGLPSTVKLTYKVLANRFPFSLGGELQWQFDGTRYQASLRFGAFGQSRVQTSRGTIDAFGVAPERFSDKYRSEVAAHFDRELNKVTFSANTPDATLQAGAQDRLSLLIQLAALVASSPERYPTGTTLTLQVVGPREADQWLLTVGELEQLELAGGVQSALKLQRNPRQPYDQRVEIWLAPGLGYLPARIRLTEANGDYLDQQWLSTDTTLSN